MMASAADPIGGGGVERHVVEIFHGDARLGAGFFVMPQYVLTARHCMPPSARDGDAFSVRAVGEEPLPGLLRLPSGSADLALIEISRLPEVPVPMVDTDRSRPGEEWTSPYRPGEDDPVLSGLVSEPVIAFRGSGQWSFEAIQLKCDQTLGDYSGYSGSPVQRKDQGDPKLLGILLEQYPDRQDATRYTDVLFAATIREALDQFERLAVRHLLGVLVEPVQAAQPVAPPASVASVSASVPSLVEKVKGLEAYTAHLRRQTTIGFLDGTEARYLAYQATMSIMGLDDPGSAL